MHAPLLPERIPNLAAIDVGLPIMNSPYVDAQPEFFLVYDFQILPNTGNSLPSEKCWYRSKK
jgi:hypothetical protein